MQIKELSELINLCQNNNLNYFKYMNNGEEISFFKNGGMDTLPSVPQVINPLPTEKPPASDIDLEDSDMVIIRSNVIGIISKSELIREQTQMIEIEKGDILSTVCAMKVYTDIVSPVHGVIEEVLFEDNDMVECEQALFRIRVVE